VEPVTYHNIEQLYSQKYHFDIRGVSSESFNKKYENGLTINEETFLSEVVDKKIKSNSVFYLTEPSQYTSRFKTKSITHFNKKLVTTLQKDHQFLNFVSLDTNTFALSGDYKTFKKIKRGNFSNQQDQFIISFLDDDSCTIHQEIKSEIFNLVFHNDGVGFLTTLSDATTFKYIFSNNNKLLLTLFIGGVDNFLTKVGHNLISLPITNGNKSIFINSGFELSKGIVDIQEYPTNSGICDYTTDFGIKNLEQDDKINYLIHRTDDVVSIITLKNSLTQNVTFTSNNNLLSSSSKFKTFGLRSYTSINSDISRPQDDELTLNYVHGNLEYVIKPGVNIITTPDTLYPYEKININDTLFVESGSFPYNTPQYADKVYQKDDTTLQNGQCLLCTWLSGNDSSSVWVDRYYYPDLVAKEVALSGNAYFQDTYENTIEQLIASNTELKKSVRDRLFFDKKSDLCFAPFQTYIYERISPSDDVELDPLPPLDPCETNINYFKEINSKGKFQLSFYFDGDNRNWSISSKRNNIDGGVRITKTPTTVSFELSLYNPTTKNIRKFQHTSEIKQFTKNFVAISVDALEGVGYFYFNNISVKKFEFDQAQFINKSIFFGDIDIIPEVDKLRIDPSYIDPNNLIIYQLNDEFFNVDDIVISLPCGNRNSVDDIKLLQNICESPAFKSDTVNIRIGGTGLENESIDELRNGLHNVLKRNSSLTMDVDKIEIT